MKSWVQKKLAKLVKLHDNIVKNMVTVQEVIVVSRGLLLIAGCIGWLIIFEIFYRM